MEESHTQREDGVELVELHRTATPELRDSTSLQELPTSDPQSGSSNAGKVETPLLKPLESAKLKDYVFCVSDEAGSEGRETLIRC